MSKEKENKQSQNATKHHFSEGTQRPPAKPPILPANKKKNNG